MMYPFVNILIYLQEDTMKFITIFIALLFFQSCYATKSEVTAVQVVLQDKIDLEINSINNTLTIIANQVDSLSTSGFSIYTVKEGEEDLELIAEEVYGDSTKWILIEYHNYNKLMREGLVAGMQLLIWR